MEDKVRVKKNVFTLEELRKCTERALKKRRKSTERAQKEHRKSTESAHSRHLSSFFEMPFNQHHDWKRKRRVREKTVYMKAKMQKLKARI